MLILSFISFFLLCLCIIRALVRFEFLEAIVRIAIAKYVKTKVCSTVSSAVELVVSENFRCVDRMALTDPNDFRKRFLYKEDVDLLLSSNEAWIRELFLSVSERRTASAKKKGKVTLQGWLEMLSRLGLLDEVRGRSVWQPHNGGH